MRLTLATIATAALLCGCRTIDESRARELKFAVLYREDGAAAGTARLLAQGSETTLTVSLTGLPPGSYELHLHANGACDPPDFASAGPQLSFRDGQQPPTDARSADVGHLPDAVIGRQGTGTVGVLLPGSPKEVISHLFDEDSAAIIVRSAADDDRTRRSGNSAGRIACGVFTQS